MSDLVKRLRGAAKHPYMNNTCPANVFDVAEAADRIEALEIEIAAAKRFGGGFYGEQVKEETREAYRIMVREGR